MIHIACRGNRCISIPRRETQCVAAPAAAHHQAQTGAGSGKQRTCCVGGPRDATDARQPGLRHRQRQRQRHGAETPVRAAQAWTADTAGDCQTNTGAGSLAVSKRIARLRVEDFSQTFPAMLLRLVGTADTAGDCKTCAAGIVEKASGTLSACGTLVR